MTTISAPSIRTHATGFERLLLRTAAGLNGFVVARHERGGAVERRRALTVQDAAAAARRQAEARAAIGIVPR